jgi:hypothetical protein
MTSLLAVLRWWVPFVIGTAHGAFILWFYDASPFSVMLSYGVLGIAGATFLYHRAIRDAALFLWDMRPLWL